MTRRSRSTSTSSTHFLNVDLELVSRADLELLLAELAPATVTLRDSVESGGRTLWLELDGGNPTDANAAVSQFITIVRALSPAARHEWDACDDRCFNIGIQSGATPHAAAFRLTAESISGIAAVGARLELTVYGSEQT
jgi:hypothetical protein